MKGSLREAMRASEKHPSVDGEDVTQTTHGSPPPRLSPKGAGENSLGTGPQSLPECGWGRRFVAPSEAEFAPIWGAAKRRPQPHNFEFGKLLRSRPYSSKLDSKSHAALNSKAPHASDLARPIGRQRSGDARLRRLSQVENDRGLPEIFW